MIYSPCPGAIWTVLYGRPFPTRSYRLIWNEWFNEN